MSEFTIVGGGIYGTLVAWHLAGQGRSVTLLEAETIASGASGGLGKRGVRGNGRDLREMPLMARAYDIWPVLDEMLGVDTGYERQGHLMMIEREKDLDAARIQLLTQKRKGIPSEWKSAEQVREMEPLVSENVIAALFCPKDGIADHTTTTRGAARAASARGAIIREGVRITNWVCSNGRATHLISEQQEAITVDGQLLFLSNPHVAHFFRHVLKLKLPIWSLWAQVMLTEKVEPMPLRHLVGHAHRVVSMKSNPDGRLMISGGWRGKLDEKSGRGKPQPDQVSGNVAEAVALYPSLAGIGVSEVTTDRLASISFDQIPIIDRIPGVENGLFATGWSGHGWAIAPAVAEMLSAWAMDGVQPELLTPFSLKRFGL